LAKRLGKNQSTGGKKRKIKWGIGPGPRGKREGCQCHRFEYFLAQSAEDKVLQRDNLAIKVNRKKNPNLREKKEQAHFEQNAPPGGVGRKQEKKFIN